MILHSLHNSLHTPKFCSSDVFKRILIVKLLKPNSNSAWTRTNTYIYIIYLLIDRMQNNTVSTSLSDSRK